MNLIIFNVFLIIMSPVSNDLSGFKNIQWGKRMRHGLIYNITQVSFLDCVENCLKCRRCASVNYKRIAPLCELLSQNMPVWGTITTTLEHDDQSVFTDMVSWNRIKNPDHFEHPFDCYDIYRKGNTKSGVYEIFPFEFGCNSVSVLCDMDLEPGGWTVIQNRKDGSVSFDKQWKDYKQGFGTSSTEYWIGNEAIHKLTSSNKNTLYMSITLDNGTQYYIEYDDFSISDESDRYRLSIGPKIKGTLDDRIHIGKGDNLNFARFQTPDNDETRSCATQHHAGWWYNECYDVLLNGIYGSSTWVQPWYPMLRTGANIQKTRMSVHRKK